MLFWLDNGYKLTQINGNSGVFVAARAGKYGVLTTDAFGDLNKASEWFRSEEAATAEAKTIISELSFA